MKRPRSRSAPAEAFPLVIKTERLERELSQAAMGVLLGVSQSCVARWESGARTPTTAELTRIGHLLNITWKVA